jgi:hypothetical protein
MEPMVVSDSSRHRGQLNELVFELTTAATAFMASLADGVVDALCDLVRSMNCYYSNLIEGTPLAPKYQRYISTGMPMVPSEPALIASRKTAYASTTTPLLGQSRRLICGPLTFSKIGKA